jgi:hypothetical protein
MEKTMYEFHLDRNRYNLWTAVTHGTDFFNKDLTVIDRWQVWDSHLNYKAISENYKQIFDERKKRWEEAAKSSLNNYQYLKNNLYKNY